MKKIILLTTLALSFSAYAAKDTTVFPEIYNFGSNVQLTIRNHTDRSVTCSGLLVLRTWNGYRQSFHYFNTIPSRFVTYRNYYPQMMGDRVMNISHSIYCH